MATYAIVRTDGREYKVEKGGLLDLDLRKAAGEGDKIVFDEVMLISDAGKVTLGTPTIKDAKVKAEVVKPLKKGPKVRGMVRGLHGTKRRRYGHRQKYTTVRILDISGVTAKPAKKEAPKEEAPKKEAPKKEAPKKEAAAEKPPEKDAAKEAAPKKKAAKKKAPKKAPAKKKASTKKSAKRKAAKKKVAKKSRKSSGKKKSE